MTKGGLSAPGSRHVSRRKVYGAEDGGFLGLTDKQWVGIGIGAGISAIGAGMYYADKKGAFKSNATAAQRDGVAPYLRDTGPDPRFPTHTKKTAFPEPVRWEYPDYKTDH